MVRGGGIKIKPLRRGTMGGIKFISEMGENFKDGWLSREPDNVQFLGESRGSQKHQTVQVIHGRKWETLDAFTIDG